ncbi:hypothetical protein EBZ80_12795 [bacterium]|nr:hypothetical protein [bacterium]
MGTPFNLKNGSVALSADVPGGLYNSAHLKKLAALSEQHSVIMKATEDQRMALFVAPDQLESITRELASGGLTVRNYQDGVHQPVSCIGALCPESKQDALKVSLDLTEALATIEASCALKIGINGCANCCVPCHTLDVAVVGTEEGYRVSLGGKQALVPELAVFAAEGIPTGEIVDKIKAVVDVWQQVAQPGERMVQVIERTGLSPFLKALAPYSQDAGGVGDEVLDAPVAESAPEAPLESSLESSLESTLESTLESSLEPSLDTSTDAPPTAEPDPTSPSSEVNPGQEDSLESSMMASMEAEAAIPVVADENAAAREEVLEAIPAGGELPLVNETPVDAMESVVHEEEVLVSSEDSPVSESLVSENAAGASLPEESAGEAREDHVDDNVVSIMNGPASASIDEGAAARGGAVASLESMEIDEAGKFVFTFGGGASITVDPTVIPFGGSRKLRFAGKEIVVGANAKGFNIAVDGLTFHMPLEAA